MVMFQLVILVFGGEVGKMSFLLKKTDFPARDMLISLSSFLFLFSMNSVKLEAFRRFSQKSWWLLGGASHLVSSYRSSYCDRKSSNWGCSPSKSPGPQVIVVDMMSVELSNYIVTWVVTY